MSWTDQFLVNGATTAPTTIQPAAILNPAGYTSSPTAAAGGNLVAAEGSQFAGLWGTVLAPLAQGLGQRIAGRSGSGSNVTPKAAPVSAPINYTFAILGAAVVLVLGLFIIKRI